MDNFGPSYWKCFHFSSGADVEVCYCEIYIKIGLKYLYPQIYQYIILAVDEEFKRSRNN